MKTLKKYIRKVMTEKIKDISSVVPQSEYDALVGQIDKKV